jgi:site-specific recombinase XerD/DNA invertase Pin-like site-specific DNA recombinase
MAGSVRAPTRPATGLEDIDLASLQDIVNIDQASLQKIIAAILDYQRSERWRKRAATARRRGQKLGGQSALTESEIALALRMRADGVPREIIARKLKVSFSTLYAALRPHHAAALNRRKRGGRPRILTESQIAHARRLLAKGATRKAIAQTLNVAPSTLSSALKRYSVGPHPQKRRRRATPSAAPANPADDVQQPLVNGDEGGTPAPGEWQARKLLDAPPSDTRKGVRDRAIMATLHYHDIRRLELCRLRVKDLHMRQGVMHFCVTDARAKIRFVPVNSDAQRRIEDYLILAGHRDDPEGALFRPLKNNRTGRLDGHLAPESISQNVLRKYRRKTGITAEVRGLDVRSSSHNSSPQPEPTPPTEQGGDWQARKLLDSPSAYTLKGVRDRAIMATLHYHDIRRPELCRLRVKDLHIRQGVMHFCVTGARAKLRFVPVNAAAQRRIEDYLILAGHRDDAEGALFRPVQNNRTDRLDGHLSPLAISQNVLRKYRRKTGITAEVRGLDVRSSPRNSCPQPEPARPTEQRE